MEVTQQLQPLQDKACQLFLEIENQGTELQQVMITAEQRLEGPVNNALIQEFTSRRKSQSSRSKQLEPSSRHSKRNWSDLSDSGRVTGECWGPVGP
jgi:hypothetical protein